MAERGCIHRDGGVAVLGRRGRGRATVTIYGALTPYHGDHDHRSHEEYNPCLPHHDSPNPAITSHALSALPLMRKPQVTRRPIACRTGGPMPSTMKFRGCLPFPSSSPPMEGGSGYSMIRLSHSVIIRTPQTPRYAIHSQKRRKSHDFIQEPIREGTQGK